MKIHMLELRKTLKDEHSIILQQKLELHKKNIQSKEKEIHALRDKKDQLQQLNN